MRNRLPIFFSLLILIATVSCTGSKSFYKKGQKLEENGLKIEAANFYIESLVRKKSNEDAIIALKKVGQDVLDEKYTTFYKFYTDEQFKEAVYAYIDATSFKDKVTNVGVSLYEAPYYQDYYSESKNIYIAELYDKAQKHLENEEFDDAEALLNEVKRLDPKYKNVESLRNFAFVEPKYRQALHAYDQQKYRNAYYLFGEINSRIKEGYKESIDYQQLALESAQYAIGILPFENNSSVNNIEKGISASVISAITAIDDPFLRLIDRTHTDDVMQEQYYNMSDNIEQNFAIETGSALGTKAILVGKVIVADQKNPQLVRTRKTGWLGKEVKYVDITTGVTKKKIVYSKVYYTEYAQERSIHCTFQYQLISTITGEVLASDIIDVEKEDKVNYATYSGNSKLLVPGYWKYQNRKHPSDKVYSSYSYKKALDTKLAARRTLKSMSDLTSDIYSEIGSKVAQRVSLYNPDL